jgi:RNA polymerase sigma factor (sigma-70 family)
MVTGQAEQLGCCVRRSLEAAAVAHRCDEQLLTAFLSHSDPAAFATMVRRHGPLVLSACRQVLREEADVEDVFQATFLVLLHKAASIRRGQALGAWLFRVARHLALKTRADYDRRRQCEGRAAERDVPAAAPDDPSWREACAALHEELDRLPEKYRLPLVLCYLQGLSRDEAARQLGWSAGAVKGRLERGRRLLHGRLERRGLALSAGLLAALVSSPAVGSVLPPRLVQATVHAATGGRRSAAVAALVEGATRVMFRSKVPLVAALVLVWLGGSVAGWLGSWSAANHPALQLPNHFRTQVPGKPAESKEQQSITYSGHVLGPDGRPIAGAKLYLTRRSSYLDGPAPVSESATTGPDGRFQFAAPKAKVGSWPAVLTATAANLGPGWVMIPSAGKRDGLTLQLVKDDVPITGQIADLEGKPLSGATLRVLQISAAPGEDLGPWLEAVTAKQGRSHDLEQQYLKRTTIAVAAKATTDAAGRFRLRGIGRNRLVIAQLDGPSIASQHLHILTRPGETIEATEFEGKPEYNDPRRVTLYYGANFRHVAAPTKPINGVVRDKDTKKPLAGFSIRSYKLANNPLHFMDGQEIVQTTTDAQGRYRLTGMPKGKDNKIKLVPPRDLPYLATVVDVHDNPGLGPVTVDFELKRGVWIEGQITDKVTGKLLKGSVQYLPLYSNPNQRDYPGVYEHFFQGGTVKEDGSYRVVGLPGPGMVAVYGEKNHYLRVFQRQDEYGSKGLTDEEFPMPLRGSNCAALTRINPAKGVASVKRDVMLDPGWKLQGTVLDPEGKPLAGTRSFLLIGHWWDREATRTAEFSAWFNPHETQEILFQHREKGWIGVAQPPKENGGSVTVRMGPGAAVTGRLVDADGRPRAGVELELTFRPKGWGSWFDYSPKPIKTDGAGRFRIEGLLPGSEFRLSDGKGELSLDRGLRSGQTKDLGEVRMKPMENRRARR